MLRRPRRRHSRTMLLLLKKDRKMDSSNGNRHIRTHLLVDMDRGGRGGDTNQNSGCGPRSSAVGGVPSSYNDNQCDGIWDPCSSASLQDGGGGGASSSRRGCVDGGRGSRNVASPTCDNSGGGTSRLRNCRSTPFIQISGPTKQTSEVNASYSFRKAGSQQFDSDQNIGALSMMHLDDPKLYIVLHFAEPTSALTLQLTALRSSLYRVKNAGIASEGMLLMNMERNAAYPFIIYVVVNTAQTPPSTFLHNYNAIILDELTPDKLNNSIGSNYISGYEEVATIVRPPIDMGPKIATNPRTAYLITIFKVFPGEDREKLERSWLLWTGARMIYKHLPQCLGLRRITFHKKLWADGGITYMLLCECATLMDHVTIACGFVEHLRARCCGYTALYKCTDKF